MFRHASKYAVLIITGLGAAACTAVIGDPNPDEKNSPEDGPSACDLFGRDPGSAPLRRLTRAQYDATVRDLLGHDGAPASSWLPDEKVMGFDTNVTQGLSQAHAQGVVSAAEEVAADAIERLPEILDCTLAEYGTKACFDRFLDDFLSRAFRRPVAPDERARFESFFEWAMLQQEVETEDRFSDAVRLAIEAALQSPHFLYRVELDESTPGELPGTVVVGDFEMASRLSYFLWGTMPDSQLFAAAERGELRSADQIEAQARRMLDDPRARASVDRFHHQWLELDRLASADRDPDLYPEFSAALADSMVAGTLAFAADVVLDSQTGVEALLSAPHAFADERTASLWGVSAPVTGLSKVPLDPNQRAGLFTDLSVLTRTASFNQSSPVARGVFVREKLLCLPLPSPPDNVQIEVPEIDPNLTTRERFEEHTENPSCAACHELIDGVGMTFESYDAIGRFRATENGKPIDSSGEIVGTGEVDGPVSGPIELARALSSSRIARDCVTRQWFRYATGRAESDADACTLESAAAALGDGTTPIRELLVMITTSDAFRLRKKTEPSSSLECEP